jgi:membrane-bound lytic murein transglycosylase A
MPVPDARPSEKIAKLFPQLDQTKDRPKDPKAGAKPPEPSAAQPAASAAQPATAQAMIVKPVPLPEARPRIEAAPELPRRRHIRRYRSIR